MMEQRFGRGVSQAEILDRLRQSGLSRAQVRSRLQQMGYDPSLADQYFDTIERGGEPPRGNVSDDFLDALQRVGIAVRGPFGDSLNLQLGDSLALDSLALDSVRVDSAAPGELEIFGRSLFRRRSSQFQPMLTGPVDPDYRLGPGDEIVLVLTGDVELAYTLQVGREGFLVIPDVGQVSVNGLTLRQLESRLYDRLGRVYSGVRRGRSATTQFQLSLGRLRSNQVYIIGDVVQPGSYQVSSVATVFNALYQAGGPSDTGSFRQIQVIRGGDVVTTVDLYEYLLRGDSRHDIRLDHGDQIFVPPYRGRVRVEGAVRRPALYEVREGEGLRDVLMFAGGLDATAFVRSIQIDRILPPDRRRPGLDRVLVDVDVVELLSQDGEPIPMQDGDVVRVFAVSMERRHRVTLTGEVHRPAAYEWVEGMTLWDLIRRAQGLEDRAYTPRAHIYRMNEEDGSRRLIHTPLLADSSGQPVRDVVLADRDSVVIFSRERLRNPEFVNIDGFVKVPGTYPLAEGMTIKDLILAAGGFVAGAYTLEAEVARMPDALNRSESTAEVIRVPLQGESANGSGDGDGAGLVYGSKAATEAAGRELPVWIPHAEEFALRHADRVFIRKAPGYELSRSVKITGEVMVPGTYVLQRRQERLASLIQRAGGLTDEAYAPGLQLFRDSSLVATDLPSVLRNPESRYNVVLQAGDSLHLPDYDPTVRITGAVTFESRVLFEPGRGLDHYINRAGGYADLADRDRVTVTYQDGERRGLERTLLFFTSKPQLQPGSTIFVPLKPESERSPFNWGEFITRTTAVLGTLATVLIAVSRVDN